MLQIRYALATMVLAALTVISPAQRQRLRFDDDWRFKPEPQAQAGDLKKYSWTYTPAEGVDLSIRQLPDLPTETAKSTPLARDVFGGREGYVWYVTDLGTGALKPHSVLRFESVDDDAVVFLNGVRLGQQIGWGTPFEVPIGNAWNPSGHNKLVVLIHNGQGQGGIYGAVSIVTDSQWSFPKEADPAAADTTWRKVHLPHDYVVEGPFSPKADAGHGSLPTYPAWYRKTFVAPASYKGKSVWIDFDGVYRDSTVYLNGHKLGNQKSGYSGFRYDLSRYLKLGQKNVLAVHVDPRQQEGWWYEGGGIYRHVWLTVTDPVHVAPWGVFVTSQVGPKSAKLAIETNLVNTTGKPQRTVVFSTVHSPDAKVLRVLIVERVLAPWHSEVLNQSTTVNSPKLWSIEKPALYNVRTTVFREGLPIDEVTTPFGIRTIKFDADKGFLLNGKPVKLKGTCNHQDHAGVGTAIPDSLFTWRIKRLKDMGSNAYRCSHNPPAPELLDACDRLGMVVMDETRHFGDALGAKSSGTTGYSDLSELRAMILRDRNHPSVIMWSMANEEGEQSSPHGAVIFTAMRKLTLSLDSTRPVTAAMNGGWLEDKGMGPLQDILGFNYSVWVYDHARAKYPTKPLYGSETASAIGTRGIYTKDTKAGYVAAYDKDPVPWGNSAEGAWKPIAQRPWVAGGFVWTGFDYKGEPTPYGWPCVNSHFGILDICGFPKDSYYYYKAWWGGQPTCHILPHWNWPGKEGQTIDVWAQTNGDRVELYLNGSLVGTKTVEPYGHAEWKVQYMPGTLVAKAYKGDRLIATDKVETTGPPASLRLKASRTQIGVDEEEIEPIEVEVLDAAGRVVPVADNLVKFTVTGGRVIGVGNGDPSSHEPDKASQRHAFNGLCMALVGGTTKPGKVVVTASSPGLKGASLVLTAR